MGCGASTPAKPPDPEPIWKQGEGVTQTVHRKRKHSVTRMSHATQDAVRDMFSEYRRHSHIGGDDDDWKEDEPARPTPEQTKKMRRMLGGSSTRVMTRDGLRKILKDVDDELFEFLWRLFDVEGIGAVDGAYRRSNSGP